MSTNSLSIEELLTQVGTCGPFQLLFNGAFCLMVLPMTYQVLIMYFLTQSPPWQCAANSSVCLLNGTRDSHDTSRCMMERSEWVYMESVDYSLVTQFDIVCGRDWLLQLTTTAFFIGAAVGALFLGWMGDNYGRKFTFFPSIACMLLVGTATAFLPDIHTIIIFRFIVGFFYAGSFGQTWIIVGEFVHSNHRPIVGMCILFFYSVALTFLGLQAYLLQRWKYLLLTCTAPYFIVLSFYKFIPESVRWLRLKGRVSEVVSILERIARWNKKEFSIDVVIPLHTKKRERKPDLRDIFRNYTFALKTVVQGYSWFANSLVYYGLSLAADDLGGSIYLNFILLSAMEFPAYIVVAYFCKHSGRKATTITPMVIGCVLCVGIPFIPVNGRIKVVRVVLGMFGKLFITMSYSCMYTWSAEIYPTKMRACGIGFLQLFEMIGGAISPFIAKGLKHVSARAPFLGMGLIALVSAGFLLLLPETKGVNADYEVETETTPLLEEEA